MPAWPVGLPQTPEYQAWSEKPQRNVATFQPEVGPPKQRRRSTANGAIAQAVFLMTDAQIAIFDTFYEDTLADGTIPFTWDHPVTGIEYTWSFEDVPEKNAIQFNWNRVMATLRRHP